MIFKIRRFRVLTVGLVLATVAAWLTDFLPLIYMMPLLALAAFHLALACPRCSLSPYVRNWGRFLRVGVPWLPRACPHCGFSFAASDGDARKL